MIGANIMQQALDLAEAGRLPDGLLRYGIRRLLAARLEALAGGDCEAQAAALEDFLSEMNASCIAPLPELANQQHYLQPPELFELMLGPRLKYSACYWDDDATTLAAAEDAALDITCDRAELEDGMDVLELGCGWGSLSLWIAERWPACRLTAVSNSPSQRAYIQAKARRLGVDRNLTVVTADMNQFAIDRQFDRVVSVEMFEHMRNYRELLQRISCWLRPEGKLFIHIFCHAGMAYEFADRGAADWMSRNFFSGGIMPSAHLLSRFQEHLQLTHRWIWSGRHYQRTADAWLANLDSHREPLLEVLSRVHGRKDASRWRQRWRMLMLAGSELFGFRDGNEWQVGHYLFEHHPARRAAPLAVGAVGEGRLPG